MKKLILIMVALMIAVLLSTIGLLKTLEKDKENVKRENSEYDYYLNKEIYGAEVTSLMNKAINENEKNNVEKDEKGYYIDNEKNSIKIELKMTTIEKTYAMEEINQHDMHRFLDNFELIKFKCTSVEYHKKTGKIKKVIFEELEE